MSEQAKDEKFANALWQSAQIRLDNSLLEILKTVDGTSESRRRALDPIIKLLGANATLLRQRDELSKILRRVLEFVGTAHCYGYKCRLPHCDCCNSEEDSAEAYEELAKLIEAALAAIDEATP